MYIARSPSEYSMNLPYSLSRYRVMRLRVWKSAQCTNFILGKSDSNSSWIVKKDKRTFDARETCFVKLPCQALVMYIHLVLCMLALCNFLQGSSNMRPCLKIWTLNTFNPFVCVFILNWSFVRVWIKLLAAVWSSSIMWILYGNSHPEPFLFDTKFDCIGHIYILGLTKAYCILTRIQS